MFIIDAPVAGAHQLLAALISVVPAVAAIILLTLAVRLLLLPLSLSAARAEKAKAALAPQVAKLKKKFDRDPQRMLRETSELYRREGVKLTGGLLPALAQAPFFMVLYRVSVSTTIAGQTNVLLTHTFLTAPLGQSWIAILGTTGLFSIPSAIFLGLLALLVLVAWFTARRIPADAPQILRLLPYGTVIFAAVVPLAAAVYLLASGTWTAVERAVLHRAPAPA